MVGLYLDQLIDFILGTFNKLFLNAAGNQENYSMNNNKNTFQIITYLCFKMK